MNSLNWFKYAFVSQNIDSNKQLAKNHWILIEAKHLRKIIATNVNYIQYFLCDDSLNKSTKDIWRWESLWNVIAFEKTFINSA